MGPPWAAKREIRKFAKSSMTDAFCMVRDAGEGAQWLSYHATKLGSPVGIASLKVKGHRRTFN
jgi:hypothetical protein|eukprot:534708-Prymnesium_polylepis.1